MEAKANLLHYEAKNNKQNEECCPVCFCAIRCIFSANLSGPKTFYLYVAATNVALEQRVAGRPINDDDSKKQVILLHLLSVI